MSGINAACSGPTQGARANGVYRQSENAPMRRTAGPGMLIFDFARMDPMPMRIAPFQGGQ